MPRFKPKYVRVGAVILAALTVTACQQRMASQPYNRPYTETEFYPDHRSARPLEQGVIHRGQRIDTDPMISGLTATGREVQTISILDEKGGPVQTKTGPGIPNKTTNFVEEFPFEMTAADMKRGKERYTIYCTPCHGVLGNGRGKIVERSFLEPTSFHAFPIDAEEVAFRKKRPDPGMAPLGYSRGFSFYKQAVAMSAAPAGYYYEVISKGYGGMPDYSAQIKPDDRWRIIAYIRALQLSQSADPAKLPEAVRKELDKTGGPK